MRATSTVLAAVAIMLVSANLRPAVVAVAPLVDDIRATTGWSSAITGLLTTLPVLVFGLAAPVGPRVAARIGIERTVFAALVVLIAGILIRLDPQPVALFGGSIAVGAGIGVCNVVLPALIKRDFEHRSGLMTGLYSMTLSGGAAVAAGLTVPINHAVGGHWPLALASWAVPAGVALIVWIPQLRYVHLAGRSEPGAQLWRNPIAWSITVFMAAQSLVFYTFAAWLPQYLIDDRGMAPAAAGAVLAAGQIAALLTSLITPVVAGRFAGQRLISGLAVLACAAGFVGLLVTDHWPVLWVVLVMSGPGASISLALLFMVLRSASTAQTGQVSGMAQSVGYLLAAAGPVAIGGLRDATGSWTLAMAVLGLALIPQAAAAMVAGRDNTMSTGQRVPPAC